MASRKLLFIAFVLVALVTACAQRAPQPGSGEMEATVNAAVRQTQTAVALLTSPTPQPTTPPKPTSTSVLDSVPETAAPTEEQLASAENGAPDGWSFYQDSGGNFSIAIPPNWTYVDMGQGNVDKIMKAGIENNPGFKKAYSTEQLTQMVSAGMKFLALEILEESSADSVFTNMNIIEADLDASASMIDLKDYADINEEQLQKALGYDVQISSQVFQIDGRDVLEMRYRADLNDANGNPRSLAFSQYLVFGARKQYIVTFTALAAREDTYYQTFLKIMKNFHVID
jgi:hypothetical protein